MPTLAALAVTETSEKAGSELGEAGAYLDGLRRAVDGDDGAPWEQRRRPPGYPTSELLEPLPLLAGVILAGGFELPELGGGADEAQPAPLESVQLELQLLYEGIPWCGIGRRRGAAPIRGAGRRPDPRGRRRRGWPRPPSRCRRSARAPRSARWSRSSHAGRRGGRVVRVRRVEHLHRARHLEREQAEQQRTPPMARVDLLLLGCFA